MQPQGPRGRAHSLKRTISKCSMSADGDAALKRFSPGGGRRVELQASAVQDAEPVLLPREHRVAGSPPAEAFLEEPEASPQTFGWGDGKERYYESVLEAGSALVSPSPSHVLYPTEAQTEADQGGCESLSAARLYALLLDYLRDVCTYYNRALSFSFAQLGQMLQSVPFALRQMQGIVKARLGLSWHLVGSFVQNVVEFICDEDIREASVAELGAFLAGCQEAAGQTATGDIFANLYEFFRDALASFKQFLTKTWLQTGRINFPCEFGKKSDTLFLCMECHREHK